MQTEEARRQIAANIERVVGDGAEYADARLFVDDSTETLVLYDGNLEVNDTTVERGLGVRVLYGGAWGFAATSDTSRIEACFDKALVNARTAAMLMHAPLTMGSMNGHKGSFTSPVQVDPIEVSLSDKLDFLQSIDATLQDEFVMRRMVRLNLKRKHVLFSNSEGSEIEKRTTDCFGTMLVMGLDTDRQMQRRSHTLFTTGSGTRGWEMVTQPDLFGSHAERVKLELGELLQAPTLEPGRRSVILLPGQGHLQVHETIGHALELDRILGYELSYAGGSFVKLDDFGNLRYGSDKLNVSAFGSIDNSPGTFGFDDDGTPERDYLLIEKGILKDALSSRSGINEANSKAGKEVFAQSGGVARATAFYRAPIDRMSNVNILPGNDGSLDDIVASTEDGVILDNPRSWSIGSNREHFHFGCEIAWEVKDGKRTKILRNPTYQGHTLDFYGNLTAVGDTSTWRVEQVDNCGKGEPNQVMQLGHGVPVVRFDDCITGEGA